MPRQFQQNVQRFAQDAAARQDQGNEPPFTWEFKVKGQGQPGQFGQQGQMGQPGMQQQRMPMPQRRPQPQRRPPPRQAAPGQNMNQLYQSLYNSATGGGQGGQPIDPNQRQAILQRLIQEAARNRGEY